MPEVRTRKPRASRVKVARNSVDLRLEELRVEYEQLVREREASATVSSPDAAAAAFLKMWPNLATSKRERFCVLFLDGRRQLMGGSLVSIGTQTATLVHPREVFRPAIQAGAVSIVIAHNHPSGIATPSREDRLLTARLREAGRLLGIEVDDHIIIAGATHCSLRQLGDLG